MKIHSMVMGHIIPIQLLLNKEDNNKMIFYLIWIPLIVLWIVIYTYFSNQFGITKEFKWLGLVYIMNLIPTWSSIVYFSKNLIFDGLLFNLIIVIGTTICLGYWKNIQLNTLQYLALGLIIIALILFNL